jgi:glycine cleavage system H lipoate-binding protein
MTAPDLCEPVIGYRAWRLDCDGSLLSWGVGAWAWQPGVNEARCFFDASHEAPVHDCRCGLYALSRADDRRLDPSQNAVGAVAAWGAMEIHRTGFRAQFAAVTGLALAPDSSTPQTERLQAAARRYRVPLVAADELPRLARRFGHPADFDALAPASAVPCLLPPAGTTGIWIEEHVRVLVTGEALRVAVTRPFARHITIASALQLPGVGDATRAGEALATIGDGSGQLAVRAPCDGTVCAVNPSLQADPDLVRVDPERSGWLVDIRPRALRPRIEGVVWGPRAEVLYGSSLPYLGVGDDPVCWQRPSWIAAQPHAQSCEELLDLLRAERTKPRFANEGAVREHIGGALRTALADVSLRHGVARAGVTVTLRLHRPEADLTIDLRSAEVRFVDQDTADIVLYTDAESADDYLAGRLDLAAALRSRRIQTTASPTRVLTVASIIKAIHRPYAAAAAVLRSQTSTP